MVKLLTLIINAEPSSRTVVVGISVPVNNSTSSYQSRGFLSNCLISMAFRVRSNEIEKLLIIVDSGAERFAVEKQMFACLEQKCVKMSKSLRHTDAY